MIQPLIGGDALSLERLSNPHFIVEGDEAAAAACVLATHLLPGRVSAMADDGTATRRFLLGDWVSGRGVQLQLGSLRTEVGYRLLHEHLCTLAGSDLTSGLASEIAEVVEQLREVADGVEPQRQGQYRGLVVTLPTDRLARAEWATILAEGQRLFDLPAATIAERDGVLVAQVPISQAAQAKHLAAHGAKPQVAPMHLDIDLRARVSLLREQHPKAEASVAASYATSRQEAELWEVAFAYAPLYQRAVAGLSIARVTEALRDRQATVALADAFAQRFDGRLRVGSWWDHANTRLSLTGCDAFRCDVLLEMVLEGASESRFAGMAKILIVDSSVWTNHPETVATLELLLRTGRKDKLHVLLVNGNARDVIPPRLRTLVGNVMHGGPAPSDGMPAPAGQSASPWWLWSSSLSAASLPLGTWFSVEDAHAARRVGLPAESIL